MTPKSAILAAALCLPLHSLMADDVLPPPTLPAAIDSPAPASKETEKPSFKKDFLAMLDAALTLIESESPALIKGLDASDRMRMIKSCLSGTGVEIIDPKTPSPVKGDIPKPDAKSANLFPGVMIGSNRILYLRLSRLDAKSFAQLKSDCESAAQLAIKPIGLVIDLRDCSGDDYKEALQDLALFCPDGKLPEKPAEKRVFDLPTAVLVGERTFGAAEVFASLLERSRQGLGIGSPTAGQPFPRKAVPLPSSDGLSLSIPQIPEDLRFVDPAPFEPSIEVPAYPQIPYEKLSKTAGAEESDKCLARAVDLLLSLDALKRKWSK